MEPNVTQCHLWQEIQGKKKQANKSKKQDTHLTVFIHGRGLQLSGGDLLMASKADI